MAKAKVIRACTENLTVFKFTCRQGETVWEMEVFTFDNKPVKFPHDLRFYSLKRLLSLVKDYKSFGYIVTYSLESVDA